MTYSIYCQKHHQTCSPAYWRPGGTTFKRIHRIVYCPGKDNDPHFLYELNWRETTDIPIP